MDKYHKIQSVYKRDPKTNYKTFLDGQYSMPEFEFLCNVEWIWREKVDGTNIRIQFSAALSCDEWIPALFFKGKSDKAVLPGQLTAWLEDRRADLLRKMTDMFQSPVCLYGEGYGGKIQKQSHIYGEQQRFILFDIKIGDQWLQRDDVQAIGDQLELDVVPLVGRGNLFDMIDRVKRGIPSSWNSKYNAEGIVATPALELLSTRGERLITKVKERDFPEL